MPQLTCPVNGCDWKSQELDAAFAQALTDALRMHDRDQHSILAAAAPAPAAPPPAYRRLRLDPPKITAGSELDQWSAFTRQWKMYKTGMEIQDNMCATALFYCCDEDLRTDLMRDITGDVSVLSETDLLAAMKRLAVKEESTLVHRIKLNQMTQPPGTGIRTFLASLRGQAALCSYTAECSIAGCDHIFDYSDEIIKDNLIRGIYDHEILADLLGDAKTDRTLDQTVSFIAQKEQGKSTRSVVGDRTAAISYQKPPGASKPPAPAAKCWACGGSRHAVKNDRAARENNCEAWNFTCTKCSTKGHFSNCCSKCSDCGSWGHRNKMSRYCNHNPRRQNKTKQVSAQHGATADEHDYSGCLFDQLCTIESDHCDASHIANTNSSDAMDSGKTHCVISEHIAYLTLSDVKDSVTMNCVSPEELSATSSSKIYDGDSVIYKDCNEVCTAGSPTSKRNPPIEHHIFDGTWAPRPSKPHPMLSVTLTPTPSDHALLGHPLTHTNESHLRATNLSMVADSGCLSSIMPLQSALAMGFDSRDIMPVKLHMCGAIAEDLGVIGAITAMASIIDGDGSTRSAKLLLYVSQKIRRPFLCRETLEHLGVIPVDFPFVPASPPPDYVNSIAGEAPKTSDPSCSCPKRGQPPPPLPTELPSGLEATEENIPALKQWILDYYASTTFNVCEHQPLPLMNCEPLQLHVDPEATPLAVHKPALVPIHWQDKVLEDLERDVRIGVLEKVNPNTPVTWCSRMVVTAKANGSPRRTVDLQHLNKHSVRQTHHVPSPFLLASKVPQHTKKTVTDA